MRISPARAPVPGLATVWTDFRIGPDGYTRMLVHDHGLSPLRLGRVVRRIHEIETYRMMALLALPLARKVQAELARPGARRLQGDGGHALRPREP